MVLCYALLHVHVFSHQCAGDTTPSVSYNFLTTKLPGVVASTPVRIQEVFGSIHDKGNDFIVLFSPLLEIYKAI